MIEYERALDMIDYCDSCLSCGQCKRKEVRTVCYYLLNDYENSDTLSEHSPEEIAEYIKLYL